MKVAFHETQSELLDQVVCEGTPDKKRESVLFSIFIAHFRHLVGASNAFAIVFPQVLKLNKLKLGEKWYERSSIRSSRSARQWVGAKF